MLRKGCTHHTPGMYYYGYLLLSTLLYFIKIFKKFSALKFKVRCMYTDNSSPCMFVMFTV